MDILDRSEMETVLLMAFIGYIMKCEKCSEEKALERMAKLCTLTQVALGLGDKKLPNFRWKQ